MAEYIVTTEQLQQLCEKYFNLGLTTLFNSTLKIVETKDIFNEKLHVLLNEDLETFKLDQKLSDLEYYDSPNKEFWINNFKELKILEQDELTEFLFKLDPILDKYRELFKSDKKINPLILSSILPLAINILLYSSGEVDLNINLIIDMINEQYGDREFVSIEEEHIIIDSITKVYLDNANK